MIYNDTIHFFYRDMDKKTEEINETIEEINNDEEEIIATVVQEENER